MLNQCSKIVGIGILVLRSVIGVFLELALDLFRIGLNVLFFGVKWSFFGLKNMPSDDMVELVVTIIAFEIGCC